MPGNWCIACAHNSNIPKHDGSKWVFFSFPRNPRLRVMWLHICKKKTKNNIKNVANAKICSAHFVEDDFEDVIKSKILGVPPRKLKQGAIPSVNFAPQAHVHEGEEKVDEPLAMRKRRRRTTVKQKTVCLDTPMTQRRTSSEPQKEEPDSGNSSNSYTDLVRLKSFKDKVKYLESQNIKLFQQNEDLMKTLRRESTDQEQLEMTKDGNDVIRLKSEVKQGRKFRCKIKTLLTPVPSLKKIETFKHGKRKGVKEENNT